MNYDEKKILRLKYRKIRNNISFSNAKEAEILLLNNFFNNVIINKNFIIAGYIPMDGEINVTPIMNFLDKKGCKTSIPLIDKKTDNLIFVDKKNESIVCPNIMIVPIIAFDNNLNRLGFGRGYYDRSIACLRSSNCKFIGVAYEKQHCDKIPINSFDQPLDMIITEQFVRTLF